MEHMKRKDLLPKIPKALTSSHVSEGTLRLYNYKVIDFLLSQFKKEWFDLDEEVKWKDVKDIEWNDILQYYDKYKTPGA